MDAILGMGEIQNQPKSEVDEPLKRRQFYWVPIISSILVSLSNFILVRNNSVTTWCIADSVTSSSSRIMEISLIIMFSFCVVLLVLKKGIEVVLFFNITAIGLQFSILSFILRVNSSDFCTIFTSEKMAYLGIGITLLGAIVNTEYLCSKYLRSHLNKTNKTKKTIIWLFIGGFIYIVFVYVLVYLELHATFVFD
ncbi:MAG: hypothetical protein ACTSRE_16305 [Promethearchaeota archaeon]